MKKIFFIAASLFAASLLGVSCDNSDSDSTTPAAAPEIVSISPDSAPAGESVTIAGKNFSADAASNVVTFGSAAATVAQASATELVVTVPEIEAGQVDVAVKVGDKSSAAVKFTVEAALSITECNASVVTAGDIVTVEGAGFEGATIKIGETVITPTLAYDDFFRFDMPSLAKGEHQITVSKNGKTAQSEKFVYYSLPQYEVSKWAGNPSSTEAENAVAGGSIDGTELHFYFPDGLCWDADGKLCISNATKHSAIHYVDMNSKYVTCVATGTGTGNKHVYGICSNGSKVYAAVKGASEIGYVENGAYSKFTLKSGDSDYSLSGANPQGVAHDGTYLYCSLRDKSKVIKVDASGNVSELPLTIKPFALALNADKTKLFVGPNNTDSKIIMVDTETGEETHIAGSSTAPKDDGVLEGLAKNVAIGQVRHMYLDTDGYLYFSDLTACRLRVLIPAVGGDYANGVVKTVAGSAIGTDSSHGLTSDYALGDALTETKFGKEGVSGIVKYNDGFLVGGYKRHIIYQISPKSAN